MAGTTTSVCYKNSQKVVLWLSKTRNEVFYGTKIEKKKERKGLFCATEWFR